MIKVYPYQKLGCHQLDWLDERYHFSFEHYQNPERINLGPLCVVNDVTISPGHGFDTHPHNDMEIITFVKRGAITHYDSLGNEGRTEAGNIQVMSAGTGIEHSEFNHEATKTSLFIININPNKKNVSPRWDSKRFPQETVQDKLPLIVSGRPENKNSNILYTHADASLYGAKLKAGTIIEQPVIGQAYLLVSEGKIKINEQTMKKGDGAELTDLDSISIHVMNPSEIILINLHPT